MGKSLHRKPPRPISMLRPRPGVCKFCGYDVVHKGAFAPRRQWHPACALKWTIMNSPRDARRFVFVRDRGVCCDCGANCAPNGGDPLTTAKIVQAIMSPHPDQAFKATDELVDLGDWELDHITPLSQAAKLGNPPELWQLGNMATRCGPCHVIKTREDRARYGATP